MNKMNIALIFAGGKGTRMGASLPKQFLKINGKEILFHTIDLFQRNKNIDKIYISTIDDYIGHVKEEVEIGQYTKVVDVIGGGDASQSPKGLNLKTTVDFYVALANKPKTEKTHQEILEWILKNPCICELSGSIGGTTYDYTNIRIRPTTTPQNFIVSENGLVIKLASANIIYDINK